MWPLGLGSGQITFALLKVSRTRFCPMVQNHASTDQHLIIETNKHPNKLKTIKSMTEESKRENNICKRKERKKKNTRKVTQTGLDGRNE